MPAPATPGRYCPDRALVAPACTCCCAECDTRALISPSRSAWCSRTWAREAEPPPGVAPDDPHITVEFDGTESAKRIEAREHAVAQRRPDSAVQFATRNGWPQARTGYKSRAALIRPAATAATSASWSRPFWSAYVAENWVIAWSNTSEAPS